MSNVYDRARTKLTVAGDGVKSMQEDHEHFVLLQAKHSNLYRESQHATSLAMHIQGIYSNLEVIIKDVIKEVDGSVPSGDEWHKQLLESAGTAQSGSRPALVSPDTLATLKVLLGFRHVVRQNYGGKLVAALVFPNRQLAIRAHARLAADLDAFAAVMMAPTRPAPVPTKRGPNP